MPSRPGSPLLGMSPVSRGPHEQETEEGAKSRQRAAKTAARRAGPGTSSLAELRDQLFGPPQRPPWFDPSIARILSEGEAVMTATGPRQLEQVTAELTGAEVYQALREAREGLWFGWWFQELAHAAGERVKAAAAGDGEAWQAPWRLLHGLAAIGPPALRSAALQAAKDAARALASAQPGWLSLCPDGAVTGRIWTIRDGYRTRFAVLAECGYPRGADPHVFSFDIDACGFITLAGAEVFDSLDQAAGAWRQGKGDAAETAHPEPVTHYAQLGCLVQCEVSPDGTFRGGESRAFADNLFRASRQHPRHRRGHDRAGAAMAGAPQSVP